MSEFLDSARGSRARASAGAPPPPSALSLCEQLAFSGLSESELITLIIRTIVIRMIIFMVKNSKWKRKKGKRASLNVWLVIFPNIKQKVWIKTIGQKRWVVSPNPATLQTLGWLCCQLYVRNQISTTLSSLYILYFETIQISKCCEEI